MTSDATLATLLHSADKSRTAIVLPETDRRLSYTAFDDEIERLAAGLRHSGLGPGDAVGIVFPNGLENLVSFLAVVRARLIAAPLNPAYKVDEFRYYLQDIGVKALLGPKEQHPCRDAAADLGVPYWEVESTSMGNVTAAGPGYRGSNSSYDRAVPEDAALFLHTSGTTSKPKGVPLTHANLMASVANIVKHYQLSPTDVSLLVMPLFHVHGLIGATLSTFQAGGTLVAPARFSASHFWPTAREQGATWYSAVPTIHQVLLSRADADGAPHECGLRFIRSCSSALAPATLHQLESRFQAPVLEAYAMTEASHQMTSNPLPPGERKPGSVGRGTNVDVSIMDEAGVLLPVGTPGEVVVRGPNVTKGYRHNPEANAASFVNGWFRTGDRGVQDGDGYVTLIGRIKELINRGGEKISPLEVDAALLAHPAVAEAATFAAADPKYGEEVHAAVVLKAKATVTELQAHCRERLADFKAPKVIHIVKELPRTATGKVQRRHVAEAFANRS